MHPLKGASLVRDHHQRFRKHLPKDKSHLLSEPIFDVDPQKECAEQRGWRAPVLRGQNWDCLICTQDAGSL
jgi:hypothetical protein